MRIWRSRCRLPAAVDSTLAVLECRQCCDVSEHQRLAWSMVIVRMVNGVVDAQQKRVHAQSVRHLATTIRLPRMLVDIRHDATHNDLPSTALLKIAINEAWQWLRREYWEAQDAHFGVVAESLHDALLEYKRVMRAHMKNKSNHNHDAIANLMSTIRSVSPASEMLCTLLIPMLLNPLEKLVLKLPKKVVPTTSSNVETVFKKCKLMWLHPLIKFGRHFRLFYSSFLLATARQLVECSTCMAQKRTNALEWECLLLVKWIKELLHSQFPFVTGANVIKVNDDSDDDGGAVITDDHSVIGHNIDDLGALVVNILDTCLKELNEWTAPIASISLDISLKLCDNKNCLCAHHQHQQLIRAIIEFHNRPRNLEKSGTHSLVVTGRHKHVHSRDDDEALLVKMDRLCDMQRISKRPRVTPRPWVPVKKWAPLPIGSFVECHANGTFYDVTDEVVDGFVAKHQQNFEHPMIVGEDGGEAPSLSSSSSSSKVRQDTVSQTSDAQPPPPPYEYYTSFNDDVLADNENIVLDLY